MNKQVERREARIRAKARALWEEAGRPDDPQDEHWMNAARLIDAEQHKEDYRDEKTGPGVDIAPADDGNSLGDIRPAGPARGL